MKLLRAAVVLVGVGLAIACGGGSGGGTGGGGGGSTMPRCPYSTASTGGGSCQVNFFCDGGDLSVYCLGTGDGGASCECQQGGTKTPLDKPDLCTLEGSKRVEATRNVCGWSI